MCTNFKTKLTTLNFWAQIFPKMDFGVEISKILVWIWNQHPWDTCAPIFRQNGWTLGSEFQKSKSGFGISTFKIPCVPIFNQSGQLLIFRPKFGEIAHLRAIFWFKYCWGYCRELGGGWTELGVGGWYWVELGAGGWSWVGVGARFSNTLY